MSHAPHSIAEVKALAGAIRDIGKIQHEILSILREHGPAELTGEAAEGFSGHSEAIESRLEKEITRVLRARDLSLYPIQVNDVRGAYDLVMELRTKGYSADVYLPPNPYERPRAGRPYFSREESESVWIGCSVPLQVARDVLTIAHKHWPFLQYFAVSGDEGFEPTYTGSMIFLGGSTSTAKERKYQPWKKEDFAKLASMSTLGELHNFIRSFYA